MVTGQQQINKYKTTNWIAASASAAAGIFISFLIILITFPFFLILIPLLKFIVHFTITPLLKLGGFYKYYSPLLMVVGSSSNDWEIHGGTLLDFILNFRFNEKGKRARLKVMHLYLEGIKKMIDDLEQKENKNSIRITGISYISSDKTSRDLGFKIERASLFRRVLFFVDYVNLTIMYSFTKGRFALPNILNVKKMVVNGSKLVESKEKIIEMISLINKREQTPAAA